MGSCLQLADQLSIDTLFTKAPLIAGGKTRIRATPHVVGALLRRPWRQRLPVRSLTCNDTMRVTKNRNAIRGTSRKLLTLPTSSGPRRDAARNGAIRSPLRHNENRFLKARATRSM